MSDRLPTQLEEELTRAKIEEARHGAEKARLEAERNALALRHEQREEQAELAIGWRQRIYPFWGGVTSSTSKSCIDTLSHWSRQFPGQEVTLVFNSPGGSVIDGLALFDFLQELQAGGTPLTTVTLGMAASMGGILLQAGGKRVMGRHAWLLIHEISSMTGGKASDIEDEIAFIKRLQGQSLDILASRSTLTAKQIAARWKRKDWWLSADEAVALGFADEVRGAV